jgi:dihydrolipoamide dehydrogenase
MLAHKAEHEGVICVEAIAGMHPHPMNKNLIPGCTYCQPQVASVGLTEAKAKEGGREIRVGRFPFTGNGKAIALGEDQGLVKVIFDKKTNNVAATIDDGKGKVETLAFDRVISAVGVVGNIEGLGLEALGVKTERGLVAIDKFCRTNVKGIYAIGDVAGPPMLAHKAEHEGVICVEAIKGLHPHPMDKLKIPGCTYCNPQVASVGLTEKAAKAAGRKIKVGRFPFIGNGKAIALGEPDGLVKTIFDADTGELIGAHMVGAEVTELIQGFVVAMNCETTEAELIETVFPHPTLSEMMHESVLDAYGRVLNI